MKVHNIPSKYLDSFYQGMMDIQMSRNPLAEECIVIFNSKRYDHYQDSLLEEESRVKKLSLVTKNLDMNYVQQSDFLTDDMVGLFEDQDNLPWRISMTITNLDRIPTQSDQVMLDGLLYQVAAVRPVNRSIESAIHLYVHPDRTEVDPLKVYSIKDLGDGYMDILYGGAPISYSLDSKSISDKSLRKDFTSRPPKETSGTLYLFDKYDNYTSFPFTLSV